MRASKAGIGGQEAGSQERVISPVVAFSLVAAEGVVKALEQLTLLPSAQSHKIDQSGCEAPLAWTGRAAGNKISLDGHLGVCPEDGHPGSGWVYIYKSRAFVVCRILVLLVRPSELGHAALR